MSSRVRVAQYTRHVRRKCSDKVQEAEKQAHLAARQRSMIKLVQGIDKHFDALALLEARKEGYLPDPPAEQRL